MAHRDVASQFPSAATAGRFVSLLGDAELDEGAIWEAVADPAVAKLGKLLWVVDLNRQSLDRVVPDIQLEKLQGMFAAAGWQVLILKWGRLISEIFERPGGAELRGRLEAMSNVEYQRMLRVDPSEIVERIVADSGSAQLRTLLDSMTPSELSAAVRDLGGHDLGLLVDTLPGRPRHPPHGRLRLHRQGPRAADRGSPQQPLRAADRRPDGGVGGLAPREHMFMDEFLRVRDPDGSGAAVLGGRACARWFL